MFTRPMTLFNMLPAIVITVAVGYTIRRNGPQGFVHGFGDLARLDADQRSRIGRRVGNLLFTVAAFIACFAIFSCFFANNSIAMVAASAVLVIGVGAGMLQMIRYLARMTKPGSEARRGG